MGQHHVLDFLCTFYDWPPVRATRLNLFLREPATEDNPAPVSHSNYKNISKLFVSDSGLIAFCHKVNGSKDEYLISNLPFKIICEPVNDDK